MARGRERRAAAVARAMAELRKVVPNAGAYVSESNYFETDWNARSGVPTPRASRQRRRRYDPDGLFFVHHGVGSEGWSDDGFRRRA